MKTENNIEITHKESLTNILLRLLEIAGIESKESKNFERDYMKYLKFQNEVDWKRYRASIDLLNDTEYAIKDAFEYQLGRKGNSSLGEHYLRLYGILNAVYLQMSAYKEISMLLNYPQKDSVEPDFNKLNIYKLRNIAASHTVNYKYEKNKSESTIPSKSYRLIQSDLNYSGSHITILSENNIILKFNLINVLSEYETMSRLLLIKLINHAITNLVYKKEYRQLMKQWLKERLESIIDYSTINKNL